VGAAATLTDARAMTAAVGIPRALVALLMAALPFHGQATTPGSPARAAPVERLVASGACRDGAPNGAFELRMPDGRLRVLGAFAKGHRTGTFLFWSATGARSAVIPYEDDLKVGTVALWYAPATRQGELRRRLESAYSAGALHGLTRSWHTNGKRRAEYRYERGELAAVEAWGETGEPLPEPAARRLAERDRATEAELYADLERTIAENLPLCL
jgi:antitoxin component YwqK of YwqJK toxin-antitoxin module